MSNKMAPDLGKLDELAKVHALSYASPHHFTMSVNGLREVIAELQPPAGNKMALDRADRKGYMPDAIYSAYEGFQYRDPASTVAAITAQRDAALARVAELEKDAARGRLLLKWLWSGHIPGPAWGRPIKLVETCPQFGDETEVKNIEALLDAFLTKGQP